MMRRSWIFVFLLFLLPCCLCAEDEWMLVRDDEGIKVYTRMIPKSPLVACKVVCEMDTPLEAIRELLLDTAATTRWYHHCRECREIWRGKDDRQLLYYLVFRGIWPMADRDIVASLHITRNDSEEFVCKTEALGENSQWFVPLNKNCVRVTDSVSTFRITRIGRDRTLLVYEAMTDPSGNVPAFLVNRYMAVIPFQTIRNMRTFLSSTKGCCRLAVIPDDRKRASQAASCTIGSFLANPETAIPGTWR